MRLPAVLSLITGAAWSGLVAAEPVLHQSPFLPAPGQSTAAVATAPGTHEFTGVIITGKTVLINLTDTQARRSFWIQVGRTEDGVEVLDYDRKNDAATVRLRGETRRLVLKQPAVVASSGTTVATVQVAPSVPLPPPSTPAEAEREARMLVSDLLEIGMQQRKAYEEAQRKASAEAARRTGAKPLTPVPAP